MKSQGITIRTDQKKWVDENEVNLSRLVREAIDREIAKREGKFEEGKLLKMKIVNMGDKWEDIKDKEGKVHLTLEPKGDKMKKGALIPKEPPKEVIKEG